MFERVIMKQLNDHIWLMDDAHEATGYIVIGNEKALVIDTMNGYEDVRGIAATVTDKPVMVINTHGHCDHIYGNVWFDEAFIDEKDLGIASNHSAMPEFVSECARYGVSMPPFKTVRDGDVFDLGGLTAEVISLPGHTPGGICVLLREDRILFTGDGINRHLWLQLEESLPIKDVLDNMDRISSVRERADRILHGHAHDFEDISLLDKLREGLRQLSEQKGSEVSDNDREYKWFGGLALQHEFDKDSVIIYTKSKLPAIDMEPEFVAIDSYCGIECSVCEFLKDRTCGGCKATGGRPFHMKEGDVCKLASCCIGKSIRYCADCSNIPCDELKHFSYDAEHGDRPGGARIERLQKLKCELLEKARQGHCDIAVCGFSCGESCFLGKWCGWCGSEYNCCSYATVMPDGICPNERCVKEKGIDGCWACDELDGCTKGFYGNTEEPGAVNLAKAGALFIRKYGMSSFSSLMYYILTEKKCPYSDFFTDKSSVEKIFEDMTGMFSE